MKKVYIVAEISQNHNGDIDIAKKLIEMAADARCDAVKLNKRYMPHELTSEAYHRSYINENSFGDSYGEHREKLEFNEDQHIFLKKYANNRGLDYLLSVCDVPSLAFAVGTLDMKFIKIPSKELTNIPLLEATSKTPNIDVAFSIGLSTKDEIKRALGYFPKGMIVICTSEYPTDLDNVHLNRIFEYPKWRKGFSSHVPDPMLGVAAVAMGAEYIEFHITLSREMKGSDHAVALEADELEYMVACIRDLQIALGKQEFSEMIPDYLKANRIKFLKKKCDDGVYRIH